MRRTGFFAFCIALVSLAGREAWGVPTTVTFTARLADGGVPVTGTHTFVFALYDAVAGGAEVWTETLTPSVDNGLVYVTLGETDPLDEIVFDGGRMYLQVVIDGTTLSPRLAIGSVPYAIRANTADSVGGIDAANVQQRVTGACSAGDTISAINADGTVVCEPDSGIETIGVGLDLAGTTLNADFTPVGGDAGTSDLICRADHIHDARYYTEAELNAAGTINTAGNPVDWSRLKSVPASFADGVDSDTTYGAGDGLSLGGPTSTTFSVNYLGTGTSTSAARSDHDHTGTYVSVAGDSMWGPLRMESGNFVPAPGIGGGIVWPLNYYGGSGDGGLISYIQDGTGDDTALRILVADDANDDLEIFQMGALRAGIEGGVLYAASNFEARGGFPDLVIGAHPSYSSSTYSAIWPKGNSGYLLLTDGSDTHLSSADLAGELHLQADRQDRLVVGMDDVGVHRALIMRGCPLGYALDPDAPICYHIRSPANWYNGQADCINEGAHMCTAAEIYAMAGAAAGVGPFFINGDWIGDLAGDDACLYINTAADKNNFEGVTNKADSRRYVCCINPGN